MKSLSTLLCLLLALLLLAPACAQEDTTATTTQATATTTTAELLPHQLPDDAQGPVVYFTRDISAEGLLRAFQAMNWTPTDKVGVKISTGESAKSNHLRPELIGPLVKSIHGTLVECNTAYGGNRSTPEHHHNVVKERGYLAIAPFDLLDEENYTTLPIPFGKVIHEDYVGSHFPNYTSYLVLSHFKGHAMAGFGGALKNLSIGFASGTAVEKSGKAWIHSGGKSATSWRGGDQTDFLEAMGEAALAVCMAMNDGKNIAFVNVMNRLSVDCDCNGNPAEPDMHDIGVLSSTDPLALDQACMDLVWKAEDSASLKARVDRQDGRHILDYTDSLNIYHRNYKLVDLDKR